MGNSKDGKLGYETIGGSVVDVALPEKIPIKVTFFRHQIAKTEIRQYPLFADFDEFTNLKPIVAKNDTKIGSYEIKQVKCGENFQVFLTNTGEVYTCGSNKFGQLGTYKRKGAKKEGNGDDDDEEEEDNEDEEDGEESDGPEDDLLPSGVKKKVRELEKRQDQIIPVKLNRGDIAGLKVKSISVGAMHCLAVLENDLGVIGWGKNTYGQLGQAAKTDQFLPMKLK